MTFDVTTLYGRRANHRWDRVCVGDIFERIAISTPDAEALVGTPGAFGDPRFARVSYLQADQFANQIANALRARGVTQGDRVLFVCENSVEAFLTKFALGKLGAVAVPVNPSQTADVMKHALALAEPKLVIADAEHLALPKSAGREVDITIEVGGSASGLSFTKLIEGASAEPPEATIHGDDIWQILFTSGSTAMPKGVMIPHAYAYFTALTWALSYSRGLRHESQLRMACFVPIIFHIGDEAYTMPSLMTGGAIILGRRFRPAPLAAAMAEERATAVIAGGMPLVWNLLPEMEKLGRDAFSSLTVFVYGLGVLPPEIQERLRALCPNAMPMLIAGQTECVVGYRFWPTHFTEKQAECLEKNANVVGRPSVLLASRVEELEGDTFVANGEVGELVYRSPAMMAGYYRDEEATKKAFRNGWFHSGDMGMADDDGNRYMVGRIKDMIKSGGENVSAARVEAVLAKHPAVAESTVVGLPDAKWGEAITGVVVLRPGEAFSEADIIAFCRQQLSGFETPKRIVLMNELPRDFVGKVRKYQLREALLARG